MFLACVSGISSHCLRWCIQGAKPHRKPFQFDGFEKKSKMHCRNTECQHDWGIIVKYKIFDNLPVIKIRSFVLEDVETGTQMDFQKWKSINLSLKEFDEEISSWTQHFNGYIVLGHYAEIAAMINDQFSIKTFVLYARSLTHIWLDHKRLVKPLKPVFAI